MKQTDISALSDKELDQATEWIAEEKATRKMQREIMARMAAEAEKAGFSVTFNAKAQKAKRAYHRRASTVTAKKA
jgi:hypothetical protein